MNKRLILIFLLLGVGGYGGAKNNKIIMVKSLPCQYKVVTIPGKLARYKSGLNFLRFIPPPWLRIGPDRIKFSMPGDTIEFHMWVINNYDLQDTANIITRYTQQDWGEPELLDKNKEPLTDHNGDGIPDIPGLPPNGDSVDFYVKRVVSLNAHWGDVDTTIVFGTSVNHPTVKDSAYLITIIGQILGVLVEPDQMDTVSPGGSTDYHLWATNLGNGDDTIELRPIDTDPGPPPGGGWTCTLLNSDGTPLPDNDGDGLFELGVFRPAGLDTIHFIARVTSPDTAAMHSYDTLFVWGYSSVDSTVDGGKDAARLITMVVKAGIEGSSGGSGDSRIIRILPTPSKGIVNIEYYVGDSFVSLSIYDALGRKVKELWEDTGLGHRTEGLEHRVCKAVWDGRDREGHRVPSGVYFICLRTDKKTDVRRVVLIK